MSQSGIARNAIKKNRKKRKEDGSQERKNQKPRKIAPTIAKRKKKN